jgi:hypothetical protein
MNLYVASYILFGKKLAVPHEPYQHQPKAE